VILVAGLSPAWQQIVSLEELRVGEVNRAQEVAWCASGKVVNVALGLAHLEPAAGARPSVRAVAVIGGAGGAAIRREFDELRIDARWVESQSPTRVCTTILDRKQRQTTELVENAGPIGPEELSEFQSIFRKEALHADVVVLTGSLPGGVPATTYRDLICDARGRVIIDVQGTPLLEALPARPFLVKPNREELGRTLGRELATDADLHAAMLEVNRRGAEWVIVTQGKLAVWASRGNALFKIEPPAVEVVNPIGCGDCLAAGLAWGLSRGFDVPEALLRGVAAAGENAKQLLPSRLDPARVEEIAVRLAVAGDSANHARAL
jgi:tagatose 6-phosphate kinase